MSVSILRRGIFLFASMEIYIIISEFIHLFFPQKRNFQKLLTKFFLLNKLTVIRAKSGIFTYRIILVNIELLLKTIFRFF